MKERRKSAREAGANEESTEGFTAEERAAMQERTREMKAGRRRSRADDEADVLAKIAEMPEPYRTMAQRVHAIVKATAPSLWPRLWYGMPAYARDGKVVCFSREPTSSRRGTPRSASPTRRTWTKGLCGRSPSP